MTAMESGAARTGLPGPEIWAEAARRESGRDAARDAAVAALDRSWHERPLLENLRAVARRQPERVFLVDAGQAVTYGAFWNLVAAFGAAIRAVEAPEGPVAVLARDIVVAAAAVFACLGAGRVGLALDANSPVERNAAVLREAGVAIVAVGAADLDAARAIAEGRAVIVLRGRPSDDLEAGDLEGILDIDAPAFILPTSGSSGAPKLVVRSQRSLAYYSALRALGLRGDDRIMASLGPPGSFSGAIYMFAALFAGCAVHFCEIRREGVRRYLTRLAAEEITVLRVGASLTRVLAALPDARAALAKIRLVRFGGEPTLWEDVALLRPVLPAGCWMNNGYGATESMAFDWSFRPDASPDTARDMSPDAALDLVRVPAGFVDLGAGAAILDEAGALCPPGEAGELAIRSRYNALGEWVNGRLVPGRLIADPSLPGARVYFTGDLARAGPDGKVVVLGRVDRMLKINGQRVEPVEVEAAIRALVELVDVVALPGMVGQSATLVVFVVMRPGADVSERDLRERLRARLPAHMLPSRIVMLDALPRLASGKVDAVALLGKL